MEYLKRLFSDDFVPQGNCYYWRSDILWMHVFSDIIISLSFFFIPLALLIFVLKRNDLSFKRLFILFILFIFFCGISHLVEAITVWNPIYRFSGIIKVITGLISATAALLIWPLIPKAFKIPSLGEIEIANLRLNTETKEKKRIENDFARQKENLEEIVYIRTSDLLKQIQEIEAQNQELTEKNQKLIRLNKEKNNIISVVAHDLRSPLNNVHGLVDIIKDSDNLNEEQTEYLTLINKLLERSNNMIVKILNIEEIESQSKNLKIEKIDLSLTLSEVILNNQNSILKKNLTAQLLTDHNNFFAEVDKVYTTQIFDNLINNAIKFSQPGKNIYINIEDRNKKLIVEIRDEGPGISEDDMKKLFKRFQKLKSRPTGNESSSGLGLAIVKKYVEVLGGKISCKSELNYGTSFIIEFNKEYKNK